MTVDATMPRRYSRARAVLDDGRKFEGFVIASQSNRVLVQPDSTKHQQLLWTFNEFTNEFWCLRSRVETIESPEAMTADEFKALYALFIRQERATDHVDAIDAVEREIARRGLSFWDFRSFLCQQTARLIAQYGERAAKQSSLVEFGIRIAKDA